MDILYSDSVVTWDELRLPMHEVQAKGNWHDFNALVEAQEESESVKDSISRLTRILQGCVPLLDRKYPQNRSFSTLIFLNETGRS